MAIANYSTEVSVERSTEEIRKLLVRHGARSIAADYGPEGEPEAIAFVIPTRFGDRDFRLPANHAAILAVLQRQWQAGKVPRRYVSAGQARRVAWRIVRDWLRAQLAIVESGMVEPSEVFLPYMRLESGRTVYEELTARKLLVELPPVPAVIALPMPRKGQV